ncbi:Oidioi.mRNA.OKI2018_I69.PAR.g9488.t1.cds [Oikopleura dioica]|uniref:Oidioi.mRNA.OKI2018_I69.PAR.g9488.t1.cds n=1 Tax=Oikopleura dioica TaxID=34765 RepID=A0ABN7RPI5_OIKDI|nr:Oidioi.mRNA.OKI2018_I69.PAR.g9488.t1.cds [Oikopleura dioica]
MFDLKILYFLFGFFCMHQFNYIFGTGDAAVKFFGRENKFEKIDEYVEPCPTELPVELREEETPEDEKVVETAVNLSDKLQKYVKEKTYIENPKKKSTYLHIPRKPEIGKKISPTNPPELQKKIDEALAKKPKTLDPLIVSEHALKRSSTVNIASSIMQALDVRNTKIYPERRLVSHVSSCSCKSKTMKVWDFDEILEGETKRKQIRNKQYQNYLQDNYFETHAPPLLRGQPNIPLEYVSFGLQTEPFSSFILPLKIHLDENEMVTINIACSLGTVTNSGTKESVGKFNKTPRTYTPRVFDARRMTDICYFRVTRLATSEKFVASFPVEIRRINLPWLAPRTGNEFKDKVTVVAKSFMRYACLERFLDSLLKYYPGVEVIIADDSPTEVYKEIDTKKYPTVRQYQMPPHSGWFAGRGLAISQVKTEFFLWMDDDFVVEKNTSLDYLLEVIESTGYDLVAGTTTNADEGWGKYNNFDIQRTEKGFCYARRETDHLPIPGYPGCMAMDLVRNFFIARTATAGKVRMDPHFITTGHKEFFIDSIGKLRIAGCSDVVITHDPQGCDGRTEEYAQYRFPERTPELEEEYEERVTRLWHHRSFIKCYEEHYPVYQ